MSKAGQATFTGISDQADITLLYLLQGSKRSDFVKIIVEGKGWDDFALVFKDSSEDYEVKSYAKALSYAEIKKIIAKKINRQYGKKEKFIILVRKLNKEFKETFEYVREYYNWIESKGFDRDPAVKKLTKKGWTATDISFLSKTQIIEFGKIENIHQKISEYFAFKNPFYFDIEDQKSLTARFFKEILLKGKIGGFISIGDLNTALIDFERHIADQPTCFAPTLSIGKKIFNLKDEFLTDPARFIALDHKTYLNQLTAHPRLVFFLCDELEKGDFAVNTFSFFIEKVLLKECYIRLAIRLLKKKWNEGKANDDYLIKFVTENYNKMSYDFNYDEALEILKGIAQKDVEGKYQRPIIGFLEKDILRPLQRPRKRRFEKEKRGWREDEHVASILKIFLERAENKKQYVDFIFKYFDFTSDDFDNVVETHPLIFSFVKDFIKEDLARNFKSIVRKISHQFDEQYNHKYKGYEWIGSGIGGWGTNYSITDKGVVRLLFQPLFNELYAENPKQAWKFYLKEVLERSKTGATKDNPVYLKRALIPILLKRIEDDQLMKRDRTASFLCIENILKIKKGIPGTSEIIFYDLHGKDLGKYGLDNVMKLINIDQFKYKRKKYEAGYPTNLFVIRTLIKLIKLGYQPAKDFFTELIKKPNFIRYDQQYNTFELLVAEGVAVSDPDFIVLLFNKFDFEGYLNGLEKDFVWDKSGIILELIKQDWKDDSLRGHSIFTGFLKDKTPGQKVLEFLAGPIRDLSQIDPLKTYQLLEPYLLDKKDFRRTFQNSSYFRENIASMGEELVAKKYYDYAKHIIELCIDDPDPDTNKKSQYNYHEKIKCGEKESGITSVRGRIAWVLQKFALTNEPEFMEYAFEKTKTLLDLDGALAKKLGYREPDLYVRKQALIPLIELAHPWRRKKMNEFKNGLGDEVKKIAFLLMNDLNQQFSSGEASPKALVEYLLHVFSYIRDLNADDAKNVLTFFEKQEETDAHFLFTYFAEFVEDESFDKSYFRDKLIALCSTDNPFKETFAWEFWRAADEDNEKKTDTFCKVESYWKILFNKYHARTFDNIYRTLDITLTWPQKYSEHKDLFKRALGIEIDYYVGIKQSGELWEPGSKTFQILASHSADDYLEVLLFLLEKIQHAINSGVNVHYFFMRDWINIFRSISVTTESQKLNYEKIKTLLTSLYPEYLQESSK